MKATNGKTKTKAKNPGMETNRTNLSQQSLLHTYASQNDSGTNNSGNLTQIKTELKDKIQSTRERFIQLKQRKRQSQGSGHDSLFAMYSSRRNSRNNNNASTSTKTHRSNSQFKSFQNTNPDKTGFKECFREDSVESDIVDPDEEFPMTGGTQTQFNFDKKSFYKTTSSGVSRSVTRISREIPSYKLDGAKLIVNRLCAQLKKRFSCFIEVRSIAKYIVIIIQALQDFESYSNDRKQQQLTEKWKFVRNVMSNMDKKKKKQPLKDKTNQYNNLMRNEIQHKPVLQHQHSDSFQQINMMFENFKQLRASSGEGINKLLDNQENKTPTSLLQAQNVFRKSSQTRDMPKKRKDLPPQYKQASIKIETMKARESYDGGYAQTYRESTTFNKPYLDNGIMPQMLLTSRSNLVLEDEEHEGLPGLPLESPLNADRFKQRHMYLKQDYEIYQNIKNSIANLGSIYQRQCQRYGFRKMLHKVKVHQQLKRLINKKMYEVNILNHVKLKRGFVFFIKNCVLKSKFNNFILKSAQRLYEKGFDKIKENNWIVEERKEMLELIKGKMECKHAFSQWKLQNNKISAIEGLSKIYHKNCEGQMKFTSFKLWKETIFAHIRRQNRNKYLQYLIERQHYMKAGFCQYRKQIKQQNSIIKQIAPVIKLFSKYHKQGAFQKWVSQVHNFQESKGKQQILGYLINTQAQIQARRMFAKWKSQISQSQIQNETRLRTAVQLLIKPLLTSNQKQQKLQALRKFKDEVERVKQLKKCLRLMTLGIKMNHNMALIKTFTQWRLTNEFHQHQKQNEEEGIVSVSIINMAKNKSVCEEIIELDEHQEHTVEDIEESDHEGGQINQEETNNEIDSYSKDEGSEDDDEYDERNLEESNYQDCEDNQQSNQSSDNETDEVDFDYIVSSNNNNIEESKISSQSLSTEINQNLNNIIVGQQQLQDMSCDDDDVDDWNNAFNQSASAKRVLSHTKRENQSISSLSELSSQNPLTFKPRRVSDSGNKVQQNLRYQ